MANNHQENNMEAEQLEVEGLTIDEDYQEEAEAETEEESEEGTEEESEETEEEGEKGEKEEEPEAKRKKPEFTPEQQEFVNEISAKTAERYLKRIEQIEAEKAEAMQRLQTIQPQQQTPGRPVIPELPDVFDDNYEAKLQEREKAIQNAVAYDLINAAKQQHEEQTRTAKQQSEQAALAKEVESYANKAKRAGISQVELQTAGSIVGQEISEELTRHILTDDKGPQLTKYLAANMDELGKIKEMSAIKAAVYLESVIKPQLAQKKVAKPPKPAESVDGHGFPEGKLGGKGLVIE